MEEAIDTMCGLMEQFNLFEKNFTGSSDRTKGYLEGRLKGLEELWRKMSSKEMDIYTLKTKDNENVDYFNKKCFSVYEGKYYGIMGKINEHLEAFKPKPSSNQDKGSNENQRNNNQQNNQSNVKLPKISLPTFEGSYHTWMSFKNRFTSLIHNSKSLSNVEKLDYLKSCVSGEAETTIQRYQITDENYTAAVERLNLKYDNKRMLQDTQIETIIDRKEVKIETAKSLRELLDVVQESLEALKNLQVDTESWDPMLVVLIKRKLPFKTREEWEKELNPVDVPTYKQLTDFLEKRYRTVESLELVGRTTSEIENESKSQISYNKDKSNLSSNHRAMCLVCNSAPHSIMACEEFLEMTVGDRYDFVNANRVCRNCLGVSHIIKYCNSSKRCFKCNGNHHTLLHIEEPNRNSSQEPSYINQQNPRYQSNYSSNYHSNSRSYVTKNQQSIGDQAENQTTNQQNQQTKQNHNQLNPNAVPYAMNQSRSFLSRSNQKTQPFQRINPSYRTQNHQATQSNQSNQMQQKRTYTTTSIQQPVKSINPNYNQYSENETLFPTAIIQVKSASGMIYNLRALLDQCSGEVYIKESVANMLGTKQVEIQPFEVTGLADVVTSKVEKATNITMVIDQDEKLELKAHIVKSLVGMLPQSIVKWPANLFKHVKLADTNFASPNNVDIMLGMEVYAHILLGGVLKEGGYLAQNTKLGWIISGKGDECVSQPKQASLCGFTRKKIEMNQEISNRSEQSRKYFAPQRRSRCPWNQKMVKYSETNQELTNHKNCSPPRLSLINVNANRLRNSHQSGTKTKPNTKQITFRPVASCSQVYVIE